ncbi:nitrite reductase small subunit NirD [Pseudarthrobacter enclensis]|uniref:nitrite reductase small subunit NirD n=1 Tax=Pseudarthrobacter enclensis TaxID=993070 RepID=UPI003EDF4430
MTATLETGTLDAAADTAAGWHRVCRLEDLEPSWGEAALVAGRQVALFRTGAGEVFAVAHQDPATGSHVMARGILGSRGARPTISSPLHKEVYDLVTGECFSTPGLRIAAYGTRVRDGFVEVQL